MIRRYPTNGMNGAYPDWERSGRTKAWDANADVKTALNAADGAYMNRDWEKAIAETEIAMAALSIQLAAFRELKAACEAHGEGEEVAE